MREVSKIVREWNGYREIFSRPQVTENSRQYLLLGALPISYMIGSKVEEAGMVKQF